LKGREGGDEDEDEGRKGIVMCGFAEMYNNQGKKQLRARKGRTRHRFQITYMLTILNSLSFHSRNVDAIVSNLDG
jgi:hypothetical protein